MKTSITMSICLLLSFPLAAEVVFRYNAENFSDLELHGSAKIENDVLRLDGNKSFGVVKDSTEMHLTEEGMTLTATVKFNNDGADGGTPEAHDMIISKGREFIFGRNGKRMYFNFHDGDKWVATLMTSEIAPLNQWMHVAAVIERINDTAQADVGYIVMIFVNGEKEAQRKFLYVNPKAINAPIQIGNGFGGDPWFFDGEIAEVAKYDRTLTDGEIFDLAAKAPKVKIIRKGFTNVSPSLQNQFLALAGQTRTTEAKWLLQALERAAKTGYNQEHLNKIIANSSSLIKGQLNAEKLVAQWNARQNDLTLLLTDDLLALMANGGGEMGFPLYGMLNRRQGIPIFGEKTLSWEIIAQQNGKALNIEDTDAQWQSEIAGNSVEIKWNYHDQLTIKSALTLNGPRLEITWDLSNRSTDILVKNVRFPSFCLAPLSKGNDVLLHPRMSGILVPNPTEEQYRFGQEGWYPTGIVTMQFGAYYDRNYGVYFAFEDPDARSKYYSVKGKQRNLHVNWLSPVGFRAEKKGGNSFVANGKGVLEVFSGNWYDAGQIYKRFLSQKAKWWIKELPRTSTPQWFRDNTLWVLEWTKTPEAAMKLKRELLYLREYFELPLGFHWYHWHDRAKGGWPHFPPKDFTLGLLKELQEAGIYCKPYINARLWAENDGPDYKSDWMFSSHGSHYAVKHEDGSSPKENYPAGAFAVMCPAAKGWQDWMVNLVDQVGGYGFKAIYHDQTTTSRPIMCFNPAHGHLLNDGSAWLEQGYWPMYERIGQLRGKYPELCHDSEDASEPYLQYVDGYMVWRWTDYNQVPLFASIYSGRAQFTGRLFNHQSPGDTESFFIKAAEQLINSEQLGWFTMPDMYEAEKRLFIKKLMHVRYALLDYFNAGNMLKPLEFKNPLSEITTKWGANHGGRMIKTPKVWHSVWQGANGLKMILFVNSVDEAQTFVPIIQMDKGMSIGVCREGADKPEITKNTPSVSLPGFKSEIWVIGKAAAVEEECRRLAGTMSKIDKFDAGRKP